MDRFSEVVERAYLDLLEDGTITQKADSLPYTDDFDAFFEAVAYEFPDKTKNEAWKKLVTLRKQGYCKSKPKTEAERTRLTFTQVKILQLLNANPRGLTRAQLVERFGRKVSLTAVLGPMYIEDIRQTEDRYKHASLVGLEYVEVSQPDPDDRAVIYTISEKGKKVLKSLVRN
jgi:hypothetical protein